MHSYEKHVSRDSDYYMYTASATAKSMFFYPVCTGYFKYEPGYALARSHYDSFLIMLITKGSCTVTAEGTTQTATEDEVILLDCYAPHAYETATGCEALWLHFDGLMSRPFFDAIQKNYGTVLFPANVPVLKHTLAKICDYFRQGKLIPEATLSLNIHAVLNELYLCKKARDHEVSCHNTLNDTISYINEHFTEELCLNELAARCSLSPFYFTRVFTKETGMTPHQYLLATRVNAAKFLLKTTDLSIKEIAFESGFPNESSFCNTFHKWEGNTPSQYRQSGR